jgi:general nucleoside transport system permease protein
MNALRRMNPETVLKPAIALVIGLLLGALIMVLGGFDPIKAYASLLNKSFGGVFEGKLYNLGETLREITPLILTGLAVAFAFRTGLFNIGAEGQFVVGALASLYAGVSWGFLPGILHVAAATLAGALAGAVWGALVGYAKAKRGVHEVITSIMLNWIALYLSNYIIRLYFLPKGQQRSVPIEESAYLNIPAITQLFDNARINFGLIIALACAVLFHYYLFRTKRGFELRAVGLNRYGAEYAGMNADAGIIRAMAISGGFAGIAGATDVLGVFHYQATMSVSPGYGFQGIAVALIGGTTALGTVLGAILMGVLRYGASGMKFGAKVPVELINVVIALIIFFLAISRMLNPLLRALRRKKEESTRG